MILLSQRSCHTFVDLLFFRKSIPHIPKKPFNRASWHPLKLPTHLARSFFRHVQSAVSPRHSLVDCEDPHRGASPGKLAECRPSIHTEKNSLVDRKLHLPTLVCVSNGCHIAHFHQLFRRELPHIDNKINRIFSSLDTLLKIRTELNAWPKTIMF